VTFQIPRAFTFSCAASPDLSAPCLRNRLRPFNEFAAISNRIGWLHQPVFDA